jgi:hypothetical protein
MVPVRTVLELAREDGTWVKFRGEYAGLLDDAVFDFSILGRDVLDLFDVNVSRRRNEVVLLAGSHAYTVATPT